MKTFEEYMKLPYKLEIIPDTEESGFVASYPELPGCINCGETVTEVVANAEDAKRAWLSAAIEDGIEIAEPETADSTELEKDMSRTSMNAMWEELKNDTW